MTQLLASSTLTVDWRSPWFSQYADAGRVISDAVYRGAPLPQAIEQLGRAPVSFVPQSNLPVGVCYEQFIFQTSTVPTRDNLHDFFNGLCWITFPDTKQKLNELQAEQLALAGVQKVRGPVRDALTVFDENAAFLLAPQPLWDALIARDWQQLFVELRPLWRDAQLILFGHALLEKLVYPRKQVTAHVYLAQPAIKSIAELDFWIASDLSAEKLAGKPFTPLPVLGVPGWWPENEDSSFYDDATVFRPRQRADIPYEKLDIS